MWAEAMKLTSTAPNVANALDFCTVMFNKKIKEDMFNGRMV